MAADLRSLDLSSLPSAPGVQTEPHAHFVELYEDDAALVESVRTFLAAGIGGGEAAVVVATPAHRAAFEAALDRAVDLDAARAQGLYVTADAEQTLGLFMHEGRPDHARFESVIGGLLERASGDGRNVRVFGEMVALLWEADNAAGAVELEELWNRLGRRQTFSLFCAYDARTFADDDLEAVGAIAGRHSHVILPKRASL